MRGNFFKILLIGLSSILILCGVFFYTRYTETEYPVNVHFLDVGQGDSIFIHTPDGHDILIDGGPDARVVYELGKVMPFWDFSIDTIILTHPHSDHVSGLNDVLDKYSVGEVYLTGVLHSTDDYISFLRKIQDKHIQLKMVTEPLDIDLGGGAILKFLYPQHSYVKKTVDELNNTSIVNKLVFGDTSFLFMGDAELEEEQELLDSGIDLHADVLKVGHHGSKTSTNPIFLNAVHPKFAAISVGTDNKFNHPHGRVIARLEQLGIRIFRTDEQGTVTLQSDGHEVFLRERLDFTDIYAIVQSNLQSLLNN